MKIKNFWDFQGRIIEVIPPILPASRDFDTDIIFISKNMDTTDLSNLNADTIILGNNISRKNATDMESYFLNQNIFVYNIRRDGGIIFDDR